MDLLVVADEDLPALHRELAARSWAHTQGWAGSHEAMLAGLSLQVQAESPWAGVNTLLAHRGLASALVLCGLTQLQKHGLPVECVQRVWVVGVLPGQAWMRVPQECSKTLRTCADAGDALHQACCQ